MALVLWLCSLFSVGQETEEADEEREESDWGPLWWMEKTKGQEWLQFTAICSTRSRMKEEEQGDGEGAVMCEARVV